VRPPFFFLVLPTKLCFGSIQRCGPRIEARNFNEFSMKVLLVEKNTISLA